MLVPCTHRVTSVEAHVDDTFEQDKVALGKLESFEFGPQQVTIFGVKVLKQERVDGASAREYGPN